MIRIAHTWICYWSGGYKVRGVPRAHAVNKANLGEKEQKENAPSGSKLTVRRGRAVFLGGSHGR